MSFAHGATIITSIATFKEFLTFEVPIIFGYEMTSTEDYGNSIWYIGLGTKNLLLLLRLNVIIFFYCFGSNSSNSQFFFGSRV
jgi:hypothetical protein